ncbi:hypothetical protein O0I10_011482 [Lichtheimia ornata]|uniref:Uncharacterized protein n=1 Tax=Lichtheimia ornata TaxID=688661 RepID=A0AAD7XWQ8_9FUNG|nr:uncharacterized protein O0I10_011482 [Lichtheimia ornata]KAJ8652882.1 hypothetical protein O0I10_011482 [Lichtheimia ornata]
MHSRKSFIVTISVAFVLFVAYCQADQVPPSTQDSQGATTTGQENARPPNPALEECEKDCTSWGSISRQNQCKDECLWTYAKDLQTTDNPAQGQPKPTLQECEEDCMKTWGTKSKQNQCKDECFLTHARQSG